MEPQQNIQWKSIAQRNNALKQVAAGRMTQQQFEIYDKNYVEGVTQLPDRLHPPKDQNSNGRV